MSGKRTYSQFPWQNARIEGSSYRPPAVVELMQREEEKRSRYIRETKRITYVGGHHQFAYEKSGQLGLTKQSLVFFIDGPAFLSGWQVNVREEVFSVPLALIDSVACDTTSNLTLGRFLIWGPLSFAMKKQNHYMIINYTTEKGVKNSVVFDCGSDKHQDFLNRLNVARNEAR